MSDLPPVKKILILSANPKGTTQLRLGEEIREIKEGLRRAKRRERFVIESEEAVRYRDIRRSLLEHEPQILHFSGHGAGEEGLVFEDETGQEKLVDAEALAELFDLFADQLECVVLNACYSELQARAIAQHIPYVVGMKKAIGDKAAIEFSVGFYDALGAGRDYVFAHKFGCNAIALADIPEKLTPFLLNPPSPDFNNPAGNIELISPKTGVDYNPLRNLLAASKWEEADEETARTMLTAAGREKVGWLKVGNIDSFPCEDLRIIDQLWLKFSQRKFGLSVQKKIYENLGGTREYDRKIWVSFGESVGWRKEGNWVYNNSELTFNLDAPEGHLPQYRNTVWWGYSGASGARQGREFLLRAQTCNL